MTRQRKYAKCPRCCPNIPHALFTAESDFESEDSDRLVKIWRCDNCRYVTPRRINKAAPRITPRQAAVIAKLQATFGGTITHEFIGRNLFVTANNKDRKWYDGQMLYGPVGPRGAYKFKMPRLYGSDAIIEDAIAWDVYIGGLKSPAPANP